MKPLVTLIYVSFLLVFFSSCGINRQLVSSVKPSQIDKILIIKSFAQIDTIGIGNKPAYDKKTSTEVSEDLLSNIGNLLPYRIKKVSPSSDSVETWRFNQEMFKIIANVEQLQKIEGYQISDTLVGLMEKYDCNYAIGAIDVGFSRTKSNYAKQVAKSIGIGLLTLGMVVPISYKSTSSMYCFIVDRKNKNIAFFRRDLGIEKEPTDKMVIFEQVTNMLQPYFSTK